ncbi:MAG: sulfoxide reductase heme-binding subunit YedZ [Burkholderiales bacterium]|nr:sulfoxide reductase heme-binding subunit YedZ [Burkholderiales bacterium]
MFAPNNKHITSAKCVLFLLALLPAARLAWGVFNDALGANPLEFITRNSGDWTLYFLTAGLAITPLRRLLEANWLIKFRRMLGLFAFFYASLHFFAFFWFDHFFDVSEMLVDVVKRPFILVGFIAFVLLIPLAATSTNFMMRQIGGKNWQRLHKLVYLIATLGLLHFWWMKAAKHNFGQPLLFIAIIGGLFAVRVYWKWGQRANAVKPLAR